MITSSKAGQAPQDWPLLVLGAGRAYCYYQTGVLAYTGRFIPPPDRSRELAELDRRCAGGESISVDALVWEPDGSEARQFMQAVHEFARRAGGLRYHRESRENFPLELLSDWVRAYVPVVRISEQNDASIVQSNYSSQPIRTVLVFANP
ncbi:MAG: hypothetical protein KDK27_10515, partial [Leptospiraceae bacterium]|nr:hypothetical protein [Leptospiraceae bacterium]